MGAWLRLAAAIDGGRWQRLNERVVGLHNGPLTQRAAAANASDAATSRGTGEEDVPPPQDAAAALQRPLDATFRRQNGSAFYVEVDGSVHLKLEVRAQDDIKDNDARLGKKLVLRYASVLIYTDHLDAVRQIRTALDDQLGIQGAHD